MQCRNSPLAKSPPPNLPKIPGVTTPDTSVLENGRQQDKTHGKPGGMHLNKLGGTHLDKPGGMYLNKRMGGRGVVRNKTSRGCAIKQAGGVQ